MEMKNIKFCIWKQISVCFFCLKEAPVRVGNGRVDLLSHFISLMTHFRFKLMNFFFPSEIFAAARAIAVIIDFSINLSNFLKGENVMEERT
jgi:hypothetical protein